MVACRPTVTYDCVMKNDNIFIGVDCSTTATKVIAFDPRGHVVAQGKKLHETYTESPGRVEQDAEEWWSALCDSCRQIMSADSLARAKISGISITHQRFSFVPVDTSLNPIRRAILWNDLRCAAEAQRAREEIGTDEVFRRTGYPPGQWTLYKVAWLKEREPVVYEKAKKMLLVQDFLVFRLTGMLSTCQSSAAMTGALDIEHPTRWAGDIIDRLGIRRDLWVEPILPGATCAGKIHRAASESTGLPEGLPVFVSAGDQPCGSLGAGVERPGQLGINGGTSCSNEFIVDNLPDRIKPTYFIEISPTGRYIVENDIPSGGSAVMGWYRENFGAMEVQRAHELDKNVWNHIYEQVSSAPVGNRGFMIVPYLQGVYGPYWDQGARGACIGLGSDVGRPNLIRGLLEGVAYESRREVEMMSEASGTGVDEIRMYGGSARSDHWNQIFADVFNKPLSVPESTETTALGAAISVAVGSGAFASFESAVSSMVRIKRSYTPIAPHVELYDRYYHRVYSRLYESIIELNDEITHINKELEG